MRGGQPGVSWCDTCDLMGKICKDFATLIAGIRNSWKGPETILFHPSCHGQGHLPPEQVGQSHSVA